MLNFVIFEIWIVIRIVQGDKIIRKKAVAQRYNFLIFIFWKIPQI